MKDISLIDSIVFMLEVQNSFVLPILRAMFGVTDDVLENVPYSSVDLDYRIDCEGL